MAQGSITTTLKLAWWVDWYLTGVLLVARLTGLEPDWAKVLATVERGIRVKVQP